jgi:hypothetical protein
MKLDGRACETHVLVMGKMPCYARASIGFVQPQLDDICRVMGPEAAAFCIGVQGNTLNLRHGRCHGSTLRAIQLLHVLLFTPPGTTVRLVDILTSMRYVRPAPTAEPVKTPQVEQT